MKSHQKGEVTVYNTSDPRENYQIKWMAHSGLQFTIQSKISRTPALFQALLDTTDVTVKQDSWRLCPTTLGSIPSLSQKPEGNNLKGEVYLSSRCQSFYYTVTWLWFLNCSEAEYCDREHTVETESHVWEGRAFFFPYCTQTLGKECLKVAVEKYQCTQKTVSLLHPEKLLLWTHKG